MCLRSRPAPEVALDEEVGLLRVASGEHQAILRADKPGKALKPRRRAHHLPGGRPRLDLRIWEGSGNFDGHSGERQASLSELVSQAQHANREAFDTTFRIQCNTKTVFSGSMRPAARMAEAGCGQAAPRCALAYTVSVACTVCDPT